jgi:hypothetical protein
MMKITLEPTGELQTVNGAPVRVWKGETDTGVPLTAYIAIVQVHKDHDNSEFERALREVKPERQLVSFDFRMVM